MRLHYCYLPPTPGAEQVCLLDKETALRRQAPPDAFFAEALEQETRPDGTVLRFDARAGAWDRVSMFIDEESQCCPFLAFEAWQDGGEVVLRMTMEGNA